MMNFLGEEVDLESFPGYRITSIALKLVGTKEIWGRARLITINGDSKYKSYIMLLPY